MAKESVAILKGRIDVSEVLDELNAALSEEWLAFYQYWVGALVVKGAMRGDVQREFQEHAMEEFEHAKLIADRIIELEGVPVLDPKKWFDLSIAETLSTPALRMASNEFLMELFRSGKISLEMLLQNGAFPFADKLLQAIHQSQAESTQQNTTPQI